MSVDVEQRIRDRAYAIWLEEGRPHGRDADHWLQAERAILAEAVAVPDHSPVVAVVKAPRKTTNAKPRGVVKTADTNAASEEPPKARKPRTRKTTTT
ncbi:hypothetical protein TSH100_19545 [Azospirillum sp. TSH100]|uniref:DUF2934 domain-containing protein n=1 Tax=Azospirillum sp. TSH100 TaxID=652764 RepID=UPI000D605FF0|nr:DUF2934 domain-containing protein [Azospirillum sp. TSH100]PWC83765.1 hypothetical protein TSH100_19545 [Azospirillum sp. TSH100]